MIIFGTKSKTSTLANGEFLCPYCDRMTYQHKEVKSYFHLYFIPLIPLSTLGEYVECEGCAGTYDPAILQIESELAAQEFEAKFAVAIRRVMALITAADGVVDDAEIAMMSDVYYDLVGADITYEELREEVEWVQRENYTIYEYMEPSAGELNMQGKEAVIEAALAVATSDGVFDDSEHDLILDAARALDIPDEYFQEIMDWYFAEDPQGQAAAGAPGQPEQPAATGTPGTPPPAGAEPPAEARPPVDGGPAGGEAPPADPAGSASPSGDPTAAPESDAPGAGAADGDEQWW